MDEGRFGQLYLVKQDWLIKGGRVDGRAVLKVTSYEYGVSVTRVSVCDRDLNGEYADLN